MAIMWGTSFLALGGMAASKELIRSNAGDHAHVHAVPLNGAPSRGQ